MQTVEPSFGTLQQHCGLRWINARGKDCAHKIMLMAGATVDLKKWMKKIMIKDFLKLFQTIFNSWLSVLKEYYILPEKFFNKSLIHYVSRCA